jgi:hypothetical protein
MMNRTVVLLCGLFVAQTPALAGDKDGCKGADQNAATLLKGFEGSFKGVLAAVNFQGESQPLESMTETHTVTSCTSFDADIRYANPRTGKETREVKFSGKWDKAQEGFVLTGPILQGLLRVIRPGQFVVDFATQFAGAPTHCHEMITVTNNAQQVIRSVQCFTGGLDGSSLGVRTALASRIH